jgi:hypothetical protein
MYINTLKTFLLISILTLTGCGNSSSNNNKSQTQLHKPSLTLKGTETITLFRGENFNEPGVLAEDSEDGDISNNITIDAQPDTSKAGTYTIYYRVTDSDGMSAVITRTVIVQSFAKVAPIDSNIELGSEKNILYYVDPRPEENGLNRALRIDYAAMKFTEIAVTGINPHSIDRAGDSDKFYIRTQNSQSFDVVNFKTQEVKTIDLYDHKPRAIGAYNAKYNLQLLSAKDMPVVDVIDVATDKVIETLGKREPYNKNELTSNAGAGSATGHALWFDEDHFGLIDRVSKRIHVFKVQKDSSNALTFTNTDNKYFSSALHAIERVKDPQNADDAKTFYALGEGDLTKNSGKTPFVRELIFVSSNGTLASGRYTTFGESNRTVNNIKPTSHHSGITPDGKYLVVPVLDGKVYFINRKTMKTEHTIEAKLGAAHVEFSTSQGLAIITNHFDEHLTFINLKDFTVKKHLVISQHIFDPNEKHLLQPHFSYVSEDGLYFYTFATQDGDFLKINLKTLEIEETLHTGGAPEQAHS